MARGFQFNLETVLKMRRRTFEEKQRVVADRLRLIGEQRAAINTAEDEIRATQATLRSAQSSGAIDIGVVRAHVLHGGYVREDIAAAERRIAEHEQLLVAERKAMVEAHVQVRALEKLREKRLARWTEARKRAEQITQDEQNAIRFAHDRMQDAAACEPRE